MTAGRYNSRSDRTSGGATELWRAALVLGLAFASCAVVSAESPATQPSGPVRLAVAGLCHGHVYVFLEDVFKRDDIDVVGMYDPAPELLERYGGRKGVPEALRFRDLERMLEQTRPEAVAVFTDTLDHLKVVQACAPRGIHVMMEKPFAVSLEAARAMDRAAREGGIHLLVNYETTWYPNTHAAFDLMNNKKQLGKVHKIVIHDGHPGPKEIGMPREFLEWLVDPVRNGGGALVDFGCYGANLATWLMQCERPMTVTAVTQQIKTDPTYSRVDDEATIIVTWPRAQAIIQASWNWPHNRKDITIYGDNGSLETIDRDMYRLRPRHAGEKLGRGEPLPAPAGDPLSYLVAVVRGRIAPQGLSSLKLNMIVEEILQAARDSARMGKTIRLPADPAS